MRCLAENNLLWVNALKIQFFSFLLPLRHLAVRTARKWYVNRGPQSKQMFNDHFHPEFVFFSFLGCFLIPFHLFNSILVKIYVLLYKMKRCKRISMIQARIFTLDEMNVSVSKGQFNRKCHFWISIWFHTFLTGIGFSPWVSLEMFRATWIKFRSFN